MADNATTMEGLGLTAVGILILIVIFSVVPMIGSSMDAATTLSATSQWNHSVNPSIPQGSDTWATLAPFLTLSAIILIVAGFLRTLKGLKGSGE